MMTDTNKLITDAEKEISRVLEKLEASTGMVLDRLELRDTEVTSIGDNRPQLIRHIVVEMKRLPGTCWG